MISPSEGSAALSSTRSQLRTELKISQVYDLMSHLVAPRPIALVSTVDKDGIPNLAPFSYFMMGGTNPPSVVISPVTRAGGLRKDTLRNILETEEFVIHGVDFSMSEAANRASADFPPETSEWDETGFTAIPSMMVKPARIAESPYALECRLHQWVRHGSGPGAANYCIGEVLVFHTAENLWDGEQWCGERFDWVGRLGGSNYAHASDPTSFSLERP